MPRALDLRALRYFVAIAEEGSLRKAAERLHLSQPPLSRHLAGLEAIAGTPLVERASDGVRLTPAGVHLHKRAVRLIAEAERTLAELRRFGAAERPVRVGVSIGMPIDSAQRLASAWTRRLGGRAIEMHSESTPVLLAALRRGELALALIGMPADLAGLGSMPVHSEPMMAALPATHPAARKKRIAVRDLQGTPLFWNRRSFNPAFHDACDRAFREAGFTPRYRPVEAGQLLTLERIGRGEGCTLVNQWRTGTRVPGVVYRPLKEAGKLRIVFAAAWRTGDDEEPAAAGLARIAHTVLKRGRATRR